MVAGRFRSAVRWLAVGICSTPGLVSCSPEPEPAPTSGPVELPAAVLRSAAYRSPHVPEGEVTLAGGVFRDTARRVAVFFQPEYAVGDLDGDGAPDAAVILATTTGGSGTFQDLSVVLNRDGTPLSVATFFLGDRVPAERVRIDEAVIFVDLTMHGPADPMCCPTVRTIRRFRLEGGAIREIGEPGEG